MGKCSSFFLAFSGFSLFLSKFYISEMAAAIGKAAGGREVQSSPLLRKEIRFWRFLDNWDKCIPWRQERHVAISVSCNASLFRWEAVFHLNSSEFTIVVYWDEDLKDKHINVKKMFAVSRALKSLLHDVQS